MSMCMKNRVLCPIEMLDFHHPSIINSLATRMVGNEIIIWVDVSGRHNITDPQHSGGDQSVPQSFKGYIEQVGIRSVKSSMSPSVLMMHDCLHNTPLLTVKVVFIHPMNSVTPINPLSVCQESDMFAKGSRP